MLCLFSIIYSVTYNLILWPLNLIYPFGGVNGFLKPVTYMDTFLSDCFICLDKCNICHTLHDIILYNFSLVDIILTL